MFFNAVLNIIAFLSALFMCGLLLLVLLLPRKIFVLVGAFALMFEGIFLQMPNIE